MSVAPSFPEVHNQLFGLLGVEGKIVVSTPLREVHDLLSVGHLTDEIKRCRVISNIYDNKLSLYSKFHNPMDALQRKKNQNQTNQIKTKLTLCMTVKVKRG